MISRNFISGRLTNKQYFKIISPLLIWQILIKMIQLVKPIMIDQDTGSITTTYKDAKQKEQSITLHDVKEWFQKNKEQKKQLRGKKSFISPHPYFEFQLDLLFFY